MNLFMITAQDRERIAEVIAYARANPIDGEAVQKAANGFDPDKPRSADSAICALPGYNLRLECGFYVTFDFEEQPPGMIRHLSMSSHNRSMMPIPEAVQMICEAFGFQGNIFSDCFIYLETIENGQRAVNVMQKLDPATVLS